MVEARTHRMAMMALLLAAALVVVACGAVGSSSTPAPGAGTSVGTSGEVTNLTDVAQLRDSFNADTGSVRLVLLLSPT